MRPVLHLDPVLRPASLIGTVAALRYQTLKTHVAGGAKQVGNDLALFRGRDKDAVRSTRQQAGEVGLAHRQRQASQVVTVERQDIEGIELHFVVMLA